MRKALKILSLVGCFYCLLMAISYFSASSSYFASINNYDELAYFVDTYGLTIEEAEELFRMYGVTSLVMGIMSGIASPLNFFIYRLTKKEPIDARWKFVVAGIVSICLSNIIIGILCIVFGAKYGDHSNKNRVVHEPINTNQNQNDTNPYDYQY